MSEGLDIEEISVSFGGVKAVDEVSLSAPLATITGLIGPNGAGKTTTFNACSGLLAPKAGTVRLFGRDVTRRSPAHRARRGLGRSFQRVEVCDSMSVIENVLAGVEARYAGTNPLAQLGIAGPSSSHLRRDVEEAVARCGLDPLAEAPVSSLSTGQKRLVELARVMAARFSFWLLDEPSSGLDETETGRFGDIVADAVADLGVGVLLVEHDMDLVMRLCERIYVLEFGRLIFEGTAEETQRSDVVRAAYLGADATADDEVSV